MADGSKKSTTKKSSSFKPDSKPAPAPASAPKSKEISDADLVEGLLKVQRRGLSQIDFGAVTRTIKILIP